MVRIGTAGWSIPKAATAQFPGEGSHLERYARGLNCAEINSSFYRPPMTSTWVKWAAAVPAGFQFSVKAPKTITHEAQLVGTSDLLKRFLNDVKLLGDALGPILFQLPPKLAFEEGRAIAFFDLLRGQYAGPVVLEPRHATWFTDEVSAMLTAHKIARVAADPALMPQAATPAAFDGLVYYRLHGSPRMYYSEYSPEYLAALGHSLRDRADAWVIFDNTASGAAIHNALELAGRVRAID